MSTQDFKSTVTENILLSEIDPFRERGFTYKEEKVQMWMTILSSPSRWYGFITVRRLPNGRYELLCGHHRVEAVKRNGWTVIPAQIVECSDEEAAQIHNGDNDSMFVMPPGVILGSMADSITRYRLRMSESDSWEEVRKDFRLHATKDVTSILAMRDALFDGTLTEKIKTVPPDIFCALAFWDELKTWWKNFHEWLPIAKQERLLTNTEMRDFRVDIERNFEDAAIQRRRRIVETMPITHYTVPVPRVEKNFEREVALMAKHINRVADQGAEYGGTGVDKRILQGAFAAWDRFMQYFQEYQGEHYEPQQETTSEADQSSGPEANAEPKENY